MNRHTQKRFHAVAEAMPGEKWLAHYRSALPAYRHWFSIEGELKRPSLTDCRDALHEFMPEFVPLWERLVDLADADTNDALLLSFYCPAPYLSGCSQAVWVRYNPTLVRNYDYSPDFCEGRIMRTRWHDTGVIASTDCLWGVLDGMNEHGLAVSLAFGGKEATTEGFGIPIILRYILEFCRNADEATTLLCRIPAHMAYNVTILDAQGRVQTVEVAPFSEPVVSSKPFAVNHQGNFELTNYSMFSRSYERQKFLQDKLYDPLISIESFVSSFEHSPLFATNYAEGFGTLYTAIYNPGLRAAEFRWPGGIRMYQSFATFEECEIAVHL